VAPGEGVELASGRFGDTTDGGGTLNETRVSFHDHVVRAGINYQFTSAPAVAKY
jgi:outer membrane immunogenic protein